MGRPKVMNQWTRQNHYYHKNKKEIAKQRQTESAQRTIRTYRQKYYEQNRERQLAIAARRRRLVRRIIDACKSQPCEDCGKTYPPYVMDFDHVRGIKRKAVGAMLNTVTPSVIIDEILKCDIICSNCHRERTHKRKEVDKDAAEEVESAVIYEMEHAMQLCVPIISQGKISKPGNEGGSWADLK